MIGLSVLLFGGAVIIHAQQTTVITGQVTDQTGAAIPKIVIVAHDELTNQNVNTMSTSTGRFTVTNLRPGLYDISASAPGFATATVKKIYLQLDASVTVNLVLKPGTATENIVVRADEMQLDLTHPQRGEVFSQDELENAPLDSGNPLLIANIEPGVIFSGTSSSGWVRPFDNSSINQFKTNGQGTDTNEFQLDGSPDNANSFGSRDIGYLPPAASIQEMKVITNPYDAQYGHTGGAVFDMVTKYGTNKFHGQIYENYRRTWLNANSHYNNALGYSKGKEWIDQYGGEADGPVMIPRFYNGHDNTFFELQYEGYREGSPLTFLDSVPPLDPDTSTETVAETGNFQDAYYWNGSKNQAVTIYNPLDTSNLNSSDSVPRTAFTNNQIPSGDINSVAQKILSYLPEPNYTTPSDESWGVDNYKSQGNSTDIFKSVVARLDHNFGENNRAYLRYAWNKRNETRPFDGIPGPAKMGVFPLVRQNHFFTGDWVHTISSKSLIDMHLSYTRYSYAQKQGVSPFDLSLLGWPSSYNSTMPMTAFPQIALSGYSSLGDDFTNGGNKVSITNTIAAMPVWTYLHGSHALKVGLDYRWMHATNYTGDASSPYLTVGTGWTRQYWSKWVDNTSGNSWASMLLGTMDSGYVNNNAKLMFSYPYFAPFLQDDWQVSKRLTLNLGIRWDLEGPPSEANNKIVGDLDTTSLNPVQNEITSSAFPASVTLLGGMTYAGVDGHPRTLYNWDLLAIQPRVGFAFALTPKTVIKGGIGTTYQANTGQGYSQGFSQSTNYDASDDSGITPNVNLSDPFPTVAQPKGSSLGLMNDLGAAFSVSNRTFRLPGVLNYSLVIERQFGAHTTVDLSYVGSRGFDQDSSDNINNISAAFKASCDLEQGATVARYKECITTADNGAHVVNPFKGVDGFSTENTGNSNGYYTNSYLSASIYTRRFPQFGDITQSELNDGSNGYNSGQAVVTYRWNNALNFHGSVVWSKTMDYGGYADTVYRTKYHYLDGSDRPWRYTFSGTWHLPVGHGRKYLANANRIVDEAVGGWVVSPIYVYEIGEPWMVPSGVEMLKVQHYHRRRVTEGGVKLIRGASNCIEWYNPSDNYELEIYGADSFVETRSDCAVGNADWKISPSYSATKDYPATGVRDPNSQQFDISLGKVFPIYQQLKLDLRLNAFNVLNHPTWEEGYWGDPTDTHFGTLNMTYSEQTNEPRHVQISGKIVW
jgi:hypothetical protein